MVVVEMETSSEQEVVEQVGLVEAWRGRKTEEKWLNVKNREGGDLEKQREKRRGKRGLWLSFKRGATE